MIKIATVFSGIGAIEHALDRMNLDHEIVFACDNGDVDILTKAWRNYWQHNNPSSRRTSDWRINHGSKNR